MSTKEGGKRKEKKTKKELPSKGKLCGRVLIQSSTTTTATPEKTDKQGIQIVRA
jgi:hypothetical protein